MKLATKITLAFTLLCFLAGCTITGNTVRVFSFDNDIGFRLDADVDKETTRSTK